MISFAGAAIVSLAITATGFYAAALMRERVRLLECCIKFIKAVAVDIGYCGETIFAIIDKAVKSGEYDELLFLKEINSADNADFSELWSEKVTEFKSLSSLQACDIDLLISFGKKLGTTDSLRQTQLCEEYIKRFDERYKYEKSKLSERLRIYKVGGIVCGAVSLILLL